MKRVLALIMAIALMFAMPINSGIPAFAEDAAADENAAEKAAEVEVEVDGMAVQSEPINIEYGAHGEEVTKIQQRLFDLGYYTGKVSGNFLDGTRVAIKRFQDDHDLEKTGIVDNETYGLLMSAEYRIISDGDDGEDVTRLQEELASLGYFTVNPTGKYRSVTQRSVQDFQKANGLKATGIADLETQRILFSDDALMKGADPTSTPEPDLDMGDVNDVVMVGDGESTEDSMEETKYKSKLTRGAKGEEVKKVQTRLKELGFFDGPITGNYMKLTMAAVELFQTHNGMSSDGITGEDTWDMLFNSSEVLDVNAPARPTPVPTPVPYAITVDVRNQVTIVYERDADGEFTVPVKRMICSTGLKGTPSDVGDFVLTGRRARWAYFSKWGSHAQYWTRINSNIAFHSVIYNKVDYMALNIKSYNRLGTRASHGCIRLLVSDAKWMYENIDEGVVVTITEDLPEDEELVKSLDPPPLNKAYMIPSTTPEPTAEPDYVTNGTPSLELRKLKRGSEGEDVYWLQMKLAELGYYTGTVTGVYYKGTTAAVKAFQKDHELKADGEASVEMQEKLYQQKIEVTPSPEPTPAPTPELTEAPAAEVTSSPETTETLAPTETSLPQA